tara:strand:+ start:890 stop:1228 length:339 start_codon:yes stop_codon:yes gene_type:complete
MSLGYFELTYYESEESIQQVKGEAHLGDGPLMNTWLIQTSTYSCGDGSQEGAQLYTCVPFSRVISITGPIPDMFIVPEEQFDTMAKMREAQHQQDVKSLDRDERGARPEDFA